MTDRQGKKSQSPPQPKRKLKMKSITIVAVIAIVSGIVIFYVSTNNNQTNVPSVSQASIGQTLSPELYQQISNVNFTTLSKVGSGTTSHFTQIPGVKLTKDGKPVVLYVGADYCPYCAAERWALAVALSKFGTFSNLRYMLSSSTDTYPNTPTISFHGSTYTSQYIDFQSVEIQDRSGNALETLTSDQKNIFDNYGQNGGIPFISIADEYTFSGSQFSPSTLVGWNWSQVGTQINVPNTDVAKGADGAANDIISHICKLTNYNPTDVCSQSFAKLES